MAEIKEISTGHFKRNQLSPFALATNGQNTFSLIARDQIDFLRLSHSQLNEQNIRYQSSTIIVPADQPTKNINSDIMSVFNTSSDRDKQQILLDCLLLPHVPTSEKIIYFTTIAWGPDDMFATLSNYGSCQLFQRSNLNNCNHYIASASDDWTTECLRAIRKEVRNYQELQPLVNDINITAICFSNLKIENSVKFIMVTASGKLVIYTLELNERDSYYKFLTTHFTVTDLNRFKINSIKWFSFEDNENKLRTFLVAGDVSGNVVIYPIELSKNTMISNQNYMISDEININAPIILWKFKDKLQTNGIQMEFDPNSNELICVVCKGTFVVGFVISIFTQDFKTVYHNAEEQFITGIDRFAPKQYLICTMSGKIEMVALADDYTFHGWTISSDISFNDFAAYGIALSKNQSILMVALYPRRPFDHLAMRRPVTVSICYFTTDNLYNKLMINTELSLSNHFDTVEMFRFQNTKNLINSDDPSITIPEPMNCTREFVYKLKIILVMLSGRISNYRRKRANSDNLKIEYEFMKQTILAINSFNRLDKLLNTKNLSDFQLLATKNLRILLMKYLGTKYPDQFVKLYNELANVFQETIEKSCSVADLCTEQCIYCGNNILFNEYQCSDNHDMARCCFSMVQVPFDSSRYCEQCKLVSLENNVDLNQILLDFEYNGNTYYCPLCDMLLKTEDGSGYAN